MHKLGRKKPQLGLEHAFIFGIIVVIIGIVVVVIVIIETDSIYVVFGVCLLVTTINNQWAWVTMLPIMATGLQASPIFASVVHCCSSIYNK